MNEPSRPRLTDMSLDSDDAFARRRARAAAEAAQHVIDIEDAARLSNQERDIALNRAALAEDANHILQDELMAVKRECYDLRQRNTEIVTKLRVAGNIIIDAMRTPASGPDAFAPSQTPKLAALVNEIQGDPETPPLSEEESRSAERFGKLFQPRTTGHDGG